MRSFKFLFLVLFALALMIPAAKADLVVNGGFEQPTTTSPAGYSYYAPGAVPGWLLDTARSVGTFIEIQNGLQGNAHSGSQLAELDSNGSTFIYQDIATVVGHTYLVSFFFAARPQFAHLLKSGGDYAENANENHLFVLSGDSASPQNLVTMMNPTQDGTAQTGTVWQQYTYQLVALSTSTRIEFGDGGVSDSYGTFLDDVSVVDTNGGGGSAPEPGTLFLLGAGAIGLFAARLRRKV